jgi:hypothetical protein
MFRANHCERCDTPTANPENDYGEFVCDSCLENEAERAWDRHNESLMSGDTPTFRETYLASYEQKRRLT